MNSDREMQRKKYVCLKSMTYPDEFQWFKKNISTLQKIHEMTIKKSQVVDLTVAAQRITFNCQKEKWLFKNRRHLFRPCYETVRNGKLFRIGLNE